MLFLPGVDNGTKRVEQRIERMLLISADFIDQAVEPIQGQVVFLSFSILSNALTRFQGRRYSGSPRIKIPLAPLLDPYDRSC